MKRSLCLGLIASFLALAVPVQASVDPGAGQKEYEQSVEGIVVRNKRYYKAGSLELGIVVGVMPYDSLQNSLFAGGRLDWHISDHYSWEILDLQTFFPSITSFTTNTVTENGISNLQMAELKTLVGTNFLVSPFYGKIHLFSDSVVYFDIYLVGGIGEANASILQFESSGTGDPAQQNTLMTKFYPMFDLGIGFKFFLNRAMALVVDLRDYVVYANTYGQYSLGSYYTTSAGLSFFLPTL